MTPPAIIFCITCKNRTQHLEQTLPRNLTDNADYPNCKFVVLDYNSQDGLLEFLRVQHWTDIQSGRLAVYSFRGSGPFRMAHAKNLSHRAGILEGGEILCNLDADNFTGLGFARYIADQFQSFGGNIFMWARMIPHVLPRGISGRIAVTATAFTNAGGYNEKYDTWGPDDKDFNTRIRHLGYEAREIDVKYLSAVRHNDKMRFREYQHAAKAGDCQFQQVEHSEETIANFGNFGVGELFKNFDFTTPIWMNALPTRIFGIGMHKTATTSLHKALEILGLDSAHWKNAHWAKRIWQEMNADGRSITLERHYALCDLPIPVLYKQLDQAYPRSKFILTVRDERNWLRSVRNHWNPEINRFRAGWNHDPFTNRIHKEVYGQRGFNEELFLERYRRHNADVKEYFKGRMGDLLMMDMDNGAGWPELCGFLNKPIPSVMYPREFASAELPLQNAHPAPVFAPSDHSPRQSWHRRLFKWVRSAFSRLWRRVRGSVIKKAAWFYQI